jgi:hypothetical protein
MDRRRFARLEELFAAALARPEAQRDGFIDEECAEDGDLAARVRRLLNADEASERLGLSLYAAMVTFRPPRIARPFPASPRRHTA